MVPASDEHSLYSQLSQIKINHFTRDSIKSVNSVMSLSFLLHMTASMLPLKLTRLTKLLGSGQFGKVHQGEWTVPGAKVKVDVAVKTLQETNATEDKVKFLQEAAIMGQFSHPNVVELYGVITQGEPVSLLLTVTNNFSFYSFCDHISLYCYSQMKTVAIVLQVMLVLELLLGGDLKDVLGNMHKG